MLSGSGGQPSVMSRQAGEFSDMPQRAVNSRLPILMQLFAPSSTLTPRLVQ